MRCFFRQRIILFGKPGACQRKAMMSKNNIVGDCMWAGITQHQEHVLQTQVDLDPRIAGYQ